MSEIKVITCPKVRGKYHENICTYRNNGGIEGIVEQHFGKTPTSMIMDTDTGNLYVIANEIDYMGT